MILKSFIVQSVSTKSTQKVVTLNDGTKKVLSSKVTTTRQKVTVRKDLITTRAIEFKHLKFKAVVDNILYDVIVIGYNPEIIFSSSINNYWEYPKPSTTANKEGIDELCIYWDYLYEDMEIHGTIVDGKFLIDNNSLIRDCKTFYKNYAKNQLKTLKAEKNETLRRNKA